LYRGVCATYRNAKFSVGDDGGDVAEVVGNFVAFLTNDEAFVGGGSGVNVWFRGY